MSIYTDTIIEASISDAISGQVVAASPGYFLLDVHHLDEEPLPVIAWRIGYGWILPVTTLGDVFIRTDAGSKNCENFTLGPDGKGRRHFGVWGSDIPTTWPSLDAWKEWWHENCLPRATEGEDCPF